MKFFAVDPFSTCQFCGHTRPKMQSKKICPTCGQEIQSNIQRNLTICEKCQKLLKQILIGEKASDRHVFLLMAYPELHISSLSGWKKFLKGKKVIDEEGELVNKNRLFYHIRTWPKEKDPETGKRVRRELLVWDSDGNETLHQGERAWEMIYEKGR